MGGNSKQPKRGKEAKEEGENELEQSQGAVGRRCTYRAIIQTQVYLMALDYVREVDNVRASRCLSHRYYRLQCEREREQNVQK